MLEHNELQEHNHIMALPSSYLTSYKNLPAILQSILNAQAPSRFTIKFLQDLGYTGAADRLVIKLLKTLGLLSESGEPTARYHEYLDPSRSEVVLAQCIRETYSDLFQINKNAQTMSASEVRGKFKTISQGAYSDDVLGKMANTFIALVQNADFSESLAPASDTSTFDETTEELTEPISPAPNSPRNLSSRSSARLVYEVNIHLPVTRDPAVYEALFSSLKKHLDI